MEDMFSWTAQPIGRNSGVENFQLGVDSIPYWFKEQMVTCDDIFVNKEGLLIKCQNGKDIKVPLGTHIIRCRFDSLYFMSHEQFIKTYDCIDALKDEEKEGLDAYT